MARVRLNPVIEELRGQIGELVFKRYGDRVVISKKPDMSGVKPSAAQAAHRERFRRATVFGKGVLADPEMRALYEVKARERGQWVVGVCGDGGGCGGHNGAGWGEGGGPARGDG